MSTSVTAIAPASPNAAAEHFGAALRFETDCSDVHEALSQGTADFVLVDVRGPALFARGHVRGAVNIPHREVAAETLRGYPPDTVFVVYCAGPHCNGAHRGALRFALLGRPGKMMIGGITGWLDEGFTLEAATPSQPAA